MTARARRPVPGVRATDSDFGERMNKRPLPFVCLVSVLLACVVPPVHAQEPTSSEDGLTPGVAEVALPIMLTESGLAGPGWSWLRARSDSARYVLFGEQHGVDGLAELIGELSAQVGFDVLAIEAGPWITHRLNETPVREVLADAPHSLAFDYDGDVELISRFDASGSGEIWGLDQSVTAIHPFARVAEISPSARGRRVAAGLSLKASLKFGEYLRQSHPVDFEVLSELTSESGDPEIPLIIDALQLSSRIYTTFRSGDRSGAAAIRERYMIDRFDSYMAAWAERDGRSPRVLMKMGGAHLIKGIGPNGVSTLGEHLESRVAGTESDALHIGIRGYAPDRSPVPLEGLFGDAVQAIVLPTATLLELNGGTTGLLEESDLRGFDALVYLRPSNGASRAFVADSERQFEARTIRTLVVGFGPLALLLLFSLGWLALVAWGRVRRRPGPSMSFSGLVVASFAHLVILGLQISAILSTAPGAASPTTGWIPAGLAGLAVLSVGVVAVGLRTDPRSRISYAVAAAWAVSLAWVAVSAWRWNIGGMLG